MQQAMGAFLKNNILFLLKYAGFTIVLVSGI